MKRHSFLIIVISLFIFLPVSMARAYLIDQGKMMNEVWFSGNGIEVNMDERAPYYEGTKLFNFSFQGGYFQDESLVVASIYDWTAASLPSLDLNVEFPVTAYFSEASSQDTAGVGQVNLALHFADGDIFASFDGEPYMEISTSPFRESSYGSQNFFVSQFYLAKSDGRIDILMNRAAPTPEPSTIILLLAGLMGLYTLGRHSQQTKALPCFN